LTVKAIENLKPGAARREIPDGEVRGLYLQIFPSGKASWAFRYRFNGRTRKLTIGASPEIGLKDARDLARAAHLRIAGGEDPAALKQAVKIATRTPVDRDLVEKVAAQFLARHVKNLAAATRIETGRIIAKGVTTSDLLRVQKRVSEDKWRENSRATAWVGKAVADVLNLDIREPAVKKPNHGHD
jgi:Arm DNA-binding domain